MASPAGKVNERPVIPGVQERLTIWVKDRFETYSRASLLAMVFLVPVIFTRKTLSTTGLPGIISVWTLGVIGLTLSILSSLHRKEGPPRSRLLQVALAFVAVSAIATLLSPYPVISWIGAHKRYGGLVSLVLFVVVMALVIRLFWRRPNALDGVAKALVGAGAIGAAYVLIQASGLDWIDWTRQALPPAPRAPSGTLGNSNFSGAFLGIVSPLCLYLCVTAPKRESRVFFGVVTALVFLGIWYTTSRGAIVAAAAGVGVMVLTLGRKLRPSARVVVLSALLVAALVVGFAILDQIRTGWQSSTFLRGFTLSLRWNWWTSALQIAADNPLFGTGLNTFYASTLAYRTRVDAAAGFANVDAPHNILLNHAAGSGFLGLGAYLLLVGSALFFAFRRSKVLQGRDRLRLISFTAVLVAYLAQGFFSIDVVGLAFCGWVAVGAIAVLADPSIVRARDANSSSEKKQRPEQGSPRKGLRWVTAGLGVGMIVLLALGARPLVADAKAQLGATTNDFPRALEFYRQASLLNPLEARYHLFAGNKLVTQISRDTDPAIARMRLGAAVYEYERALDLRPKWTFAAIAIPTAHSHWGEISGDISQFREAENWWRTVVKLDGKDPHVRYLRSENLRVWARLSDNDPALRQRQIAELRASLDFRPKQPKAWVRLSSAYRAIGETEKADSTLVAYFGRVLDDREKADVIAGTDMPPRKPAVGPIRLTITGVILAAAALSFSVPTAASSASAKLRPRPWVAIRDRFQRAESLELLAIPAFWSLALTMPHLGPLFGIPPTMHDTIELAAHLLPGLILLVVAIVGGVAHVGRGEGDRKTLSGSWPWTLLLLGVAMAAAHLVERNHTVELDPSWPGTLMHLAPAFITMGMAALGLQRRQVSRQAGSP